MYKEGSRGAIVKLIQQKIGCYPDGIWGKITTEALIAWQKANSLTPDGVAGPKTLLKMGLSGSSEEKPATGTVYSIFSCGITLRHSKRRIDDIVVHCTASREGQAQTVEQIRQEHLRRGFSDVGYHYIVYLDGSVHPGRNVDVVGAHVSGHNSYSIGVCYVGGLENDPKKKYADLKAKDTRTDAQKQTLRQLLKDLRRLYPKARISGHRDFSPDINHNGTIEPSEWIKSCPSFEAKEEYKDI